MERGVAHSRLYEGKAAFVIICFRAKWVVSVKLSVALFVGMGSRRAIMCLVGFGMYDGCVLDSIAYVLYLSCWASYPIKFGSVAGMGCLQ